jgi:NADH-quinone oxidoreductase subunit G
MPVVTINGKQVEVPKGTPVLRAAAMLGFNIPHFCYHPALSSPANCRMCLVEIERARKLEPSCYMKCTDGMVVHTETEKVVAARRAVLEFILVNHPVDCPICDQAGECKLQDYYMAYDARPSRVQTVKNAKAKVYPIGPHVVYDGERCILCTRCIRFCDEITGTSELTVQNRGDSSEIRTFPGRSLDNPYSMNVTDICPVGALTTTDFRFKCRVWLLSTTDSVCTGCSMGCNIHAEHFQGRVQRYRPRFNPAVNDYWMCDQGRLSYRALHADRLTAIRFRDENEAPSWPRAARRVATELNSFLDAGNVVGLVVSACASTESMAAARDFSRDVLRNAPVYWSGRPDGEQDDFLVRADKNPNRNGLLEVFGEDILARDVDALRSAIESGEVQGVWWVGAEVAPDGEQQAALRTQVADLAFVVVQSAWNCWLTDAAHIALPSTTHVEQDGTFINAEGLVQPFYQAFDADGAGIADWQILGRIARAAGRSPSWSSIDELQQSLFDTVPA